jgi:hypothetical protein
MTPAHATVEYRRYHGTVNVGTSKSRGWGWTLKNQHMVLRVTHCGSREETSPYPVAVCTTARAAEAARRLLSGECEVTP